MLRVRYEGGRRKRDVLPTVRYNRSVGFENKVSDIWDVRDRTTSSLEAPS